MTGYLVLQANMPVRTSQFQNILKLLARERLGTRWAKYPFSRCRHILRIHRTKNPESRFAGGGVRWAPRKSSPYDCEWGICFCQTLGQGVCDTRLFDIPINGFPLKLTCLTNNMSQCVVFRYSVYGTKNLIWKITNTYRNLKQEEYGKAVLWNPLKFSFRFSVHGLAAPPAPLPTPRASQARSSRSCLKASRARSTWWYV